MRAASRRGRPRLHCAPMTLASEQPAEAVDARKAAVVALMDRDGAAVFRYCAGMLGEEEAAALLPVLLAHVCEHATAEATASERSVMLYTMAHNRCMHRSRNGGQAPTGAGLDDDMQRKVERSLAQLRPFGRDALLLRSVAGLGWEDMATICAAPLHRLPNRVARAWRIVAHHAAEGGTNPAEAPLQRPRGRSVSRDAAAWAPIREDARAFVQYRQHLRARWADVQPPEGWRARVWAVVEEERRKEQERIVQAERAAAEKQRLAEAQRRAAIEQAQRAARAEADARAQARRTRTQEALEAFRQQAAEPESSRGPWLAVGVAVLVAAVAVLWLWA